MPVAKKKTTTRPNRNSTSTGMGSGVRKPGRKPRCFFCSDNSMPNYLTTSLGRYLTEKGKIIPQSRTGLCHKHQRFLTQEIKKARYMALVPFTTAVR